MFVKSVLKSLLELKFFVESIRIGNENTVKLKHTLHNMNKQYLENLNIY